MKSIGFVLILLGMLALVYGAIGSDRESAVLDVRPFKGTVTEHKKAPFSPIIGGVVLAAGLLFLAGPRKRLT